MIILNQQFTKNISLTLMIINILIEIDKINIEQKKHNGLTKRELDKEITIKDAIIGGLDKIKKNIKSDEIK